ncbi:L,D-transpeptidase [Tropicimonas sp. IMCC34043]|uniref:L,D-transpeptidase n=1 Tax=Tropicimonas sp. IMCC34043 TaxID=2248760 RepID=UPI000E251087|nr:L,D-transpeptidase [Tropicimonas sp. IMCC34043]
MTFSLSRRRLLAGIGTLPILAAPMLARAQNYPTTDNPTQEFAPVDPNYRPDTGASRNISSFQSRNWQDHFEALNNGAILCDIDSRALHYWSGDGETYRIYPTSVPLSEELTRRGYTEVVRKKVGPDWRPTPSMLEHDPNLPRYVAPGPGNPLGTHAMYLTWPAYLIHGTHDTRKIGRPSSSGCIGLYNEQVAELYALVEIGTQVRLM